MRQICKEYTCTCNRGSGERGWRDGFMVSVVVSRSSSSGSSPCQRHCVAFLGKTRNSHSASSPPSRCIYKGTSILCIEGGSRNTPRILLVASCYRNRDKLRPGNPFLESSVNLPGPISVLANLYLEAEMVYSPETS